MTVYSMVSSSSYMKIPNKYFHTALISITLLSVAIAIPILGY